MRLLLFDIDGTLIKINGAGRRTIAYALERAFGATGPIDRYSFAGKTDLIIIYDLMTAAGFDEQTIKARLPLVFALMVEKGKELFGVSGMQPCAGVLPLLDRLVQVPDVVLGLQTGNIRDTAPLKLAAAGIDPNIFEVGAFGSEARDRNRMPAIAWRQASKLKGHAFDGSSTVIIGDTPADIACARENGAISLAVATGTFSLAQLAAHNPDHLAKNLTELDRSPEELIHKV